MDIKKFIPIEKGVEVLRSPRTILIILAIAFMVSSAIHILKPSPELPNPGVRLLVLFGIVGMICVAIPPVQALENDKGEPQLRRAEDDRRRPMSGDAHGGPRPPVLRATDANTVPGLVVIAGNGVYLQTKYGNVNLRDDAAREATWIAELVGATGEGSGDGRSVDHPAAALRKAVMTRESGACAWVLLDPRRVEFVCTILAARLTRLQLGLICDVVIARANGGTTLGYELARQLGASSTLLVGTGEMLALQQGAEAEEGVIIRDEECLKLSESSRVVFVDDTINSGDTMRHCFKYLKKTRKVTIVAVVCLADRRREHEFPAEIADQFEGVPLVAFWRRSDVLAAHST